MINFTLWVFYHNFLKIQVGGYLKKELRMGVFWKGLAFSIFPLVITCLFSNYYIYLCFVFQHKIMLYFLVKRNIKLSELKRYLLLALCPEPSGQHSGWAQLPRSESWGFASWFWFLQLCDTEGLLKVLGFTSSSVKS